MKTRDRTTCLCIQPIRCATAVLSVRPRFVRVSLEAPRLFARIRTGTRLADFDAMAGSWYGDKVTSHVVRAPARDRRREPRVDVMMHVQGELVRLETPILVHDMSRSGFSVLSRLSFESGQQLDFRLSSDD